MCGVFVVYSKKKTLNTLECLSASKELFNRGPDKFKQSFFLKKKLFISNTVLEITGNTSRNKKITSSKNKRFHITFNGEVYNYKILEKKYLKNNKKKNFSDTEILINLYEVLKKEKIPKIINGMFAYVVYDKHRNKLLINNDAQGEKNLFYYNEPDFLIISSTIKPILKFLKKKTYNTETLKNYFSTRHYMPMENTSFSKIYLFKPGSINEYCLNTNDMSEKIYDNPLNWISKKLYKKFSNFSEEEMIDYLDEKLKDQAKLMIPDKNFGCIVSGGIDSTLQSIIISKLREANEYLTIDHGKKDHIMKHINKFNAFFPKKIKKLKINKNEYKFLAKKSYKIISSPLHTHDLPSRLKISQNFKLRRCKVFFSADGCDELFGGQQIYKNVFKKKYNLNKNVSPYSSLSNYSFASKKYRDEIEKIWKRVNKKYFFIKNKKEINIQSSFFLDYFLQSINVANRSNDLICCENSVEPRNIFISKKIIKIILNLPINYKFDLKEKNIFKQKKILKKIFCKHFNKNLIYKKSGFSGFPNTLKKKNNNYPLTNSLIDISFKKILRNKKKYYDLKNFSRDMEWKLINVENFLNAFK